MWMQCIVVLPKTTKVIGEHLSQLHTEEKKITGKFFQDSSKCAISSSTKFTLQGDDDSNSNFL